MPADAHLQHPRPTWLTSPPALTKGQASNPKLTVSWQRPRHNQSPNYKKPHYEGSGAGGIPLGRLPASHSGRRIGLMRPGDTATAPHASQANSRGSLGEGVHLGGLDCWSPVTRLTGLVLAPLRLPIGEGHSQSTGSC